MAAALACGALLAPFTGWLQLRAPTHPRAYRLDSPTLVNGSTSCPNGKWAFRGGHYLAIRILEVVPEDQALVREWYVARNWLPQTVRGAITHRSALAQRPIHRFWINLNIESEVALAPIGSTGTYVQRSYRLNACPPLAILEH
jgi:hypothetical protein